MTTLSEAKRTLDAEPGDSPASRCNRLLAHAVILDSTADSGKVSVGFKVEVMMRALADLCRREAEWR
jgi:hypothetical protein